jgi:hypothetical protein
MKVFPLGKKLTIAIDIDGTVADCTDVDFDKVDKNPNELLKATPIPGALQAVQKLHDESNLNLDWGLSFLSGKIKS